MTPAAQAMPAPAGVLRAQGLNVFYGQSHILRDLSFHIRPQETVSLLGRNGMGKTTLLRTLMGLVSARSGRIALKGHDMIGARPSAIARAGLAFVPEGRGVFPNLTVEENLTFASRVRRAGSGWSLEKVYSMFPRLAERRGHWGNQLSGGEQKMLAIGRALMGNPALLILDEPSEGLSPLMVKTLMQAIHEIRAEGVTLLIADQNVKFARRVADRGYIMEKGTIRFSGPLEELWANEEVVRSYLAL